MPVADNSFDTVEGFLLARSGVRGRVAKLGPAVDAIIRRHDYPEPVAAVLAETLALTGVLAFALKFDGIFTLQTKGDGPVGLLVADLNKDGALRGYAQFDAGKVKRAGVGSALLLGRGHLAFTVDPGGNAERYQGIVELIGRDMATCVQNYFKQSEQLDAAFRVLTGVDAEGRHQAWAIMLQRLPENGGYAANNNSQDGHPATHEERAEDWRRTLALLETVTPAEAFAADLSSAQLLHRLFHEEGLVPGDTHGLRDQCRCSPQRVAAVLSAMPQDELQELAEDGKLSLTCEFCSSTYTFDPEQLQKLAVGPGLRDTSVVDLSASD